MTRFEFYTNLESFKKNKSEKSELKHYGIIGQKWGQRRWQNADGTFNEEGKIRYFGEPRHKGEKNPKFELKYDKNGNIDLSNVNDTEYWKPVTRANEINDKTYIKEQNLVEKINTTNYNESPYYSYKARDDLAYVLTLMEEELSKEDPLVKPSRKFIGDYLYGDAQIYEGNYSNEQKEMKKRIDEEKEKYDEHSEEYKKLDRLEHTLFNYAIYLNGAETHSKIMDKAEKYLKEHNYTIDEKEKMDWVQKDNPDWKLNKYEDQNGNKHIGLEKDFKTDYGNIKVKIQDSKAAKDSVTINDVNFALKKVNKGDEDYKKNFAEYLWGNRFQLFKPEWSKETGRPIASEKQIKYIFNMDKDKFVKEMERQVIPKLKLELKDTILDDKKYNLNGIYTLEGSDNKLNAKITDYGRVSAEYPDWRNFPLDDVLE